jgi:Carboxypeptidase regulatory-like domain
MHGLRIALTGLVIGCVAGVHPQALSQAKARVSSNVADANYKITGTVVSSVDGSPVAHCQLSPLLMVHGGSSSRQLPSSIGSFETDGHGHFSIALPSAGLWSLTASARGFVTQEYERHQGFFSAVAVTPETPTVDIRFRLSPEASIAGVVLDEAGEPVRTAQITLQVVPPPSPGGPQPNGSVRTMVRTDDRGMYEMDNLLPGSYRLMVQAQPWYAAASQQSSRMSSSGSSPIDPSLDVAYPLTWFPGVDNPALAETIVLHAGDTRQADLHLVPMPSVHLRIVTPRTEGENNISPAAFPVVQQIVPGEDIQSYVPVATHVDGQGQIDVSGLAPGLYRIQPGGANQGRRASLVEVTANSTRTLDLNAAPEDVARVTIHFEGLSDLGSGAGAGRNGSMRVRLVDTDTHQGSFSSDSDGTMGYGNERRGQRDSGADHLIEVPPGRYEVVLQGRPNVYLTGITMKEAKVEGRYVTLAAGDSVLTIHVASGRAHLSGVATFGGKPSDGALVLLVPTTIEDTGSITLLRQDQTNTDGSFEIEDIIPGQYILIGIDNGWEINWGDRSTLRRYLLQGVPVELKPSATLKQNINAQAP